MNHPAETWHDAVADADAVAEVLATLDPAEWTVHRDVRWPTREFASIDHVVVGRKGVFVIDSLGWSGRVHVAQDQVRLNGCVRESELGGVVEAAAAVADLLGSNDEREVQPVLCFVRDEWLTGRARGALVCSTSNLDSMLLGRSLRLGAERVRAITRELDRHDGTSPRIQARPTIVSSRPAAPAERRTVPVSVVLVGLAMITLLFCVMFLGS